MGSSMLPTADAPSPLPVSSDSVYPLDTSNRDNGFVCVMLHIGSITPR